MEMSRCYCRSVTYKVGVIGYLGFPHFTVPYFGEKGREVHSFLVDAHSRILARLPPPPPPACPLVSV